MKSLKGQLLLDGGRLLDTEFRRTVVLICQHDANGAFGLVLNRPSEHKVGCALDDPLPEPIRDLPVFLGGPVQPQAFSCLIHDSAYTTTESEWTVLPGLRLTHDIRELLEPEEDFLRRARFKFFAGYAGWAPGQLEQELKQHAWLVHPATVDLVFDPQPKLLWSKILRTKGPQYRLLAELPEDPSLN
ncbi:MAG: YqgE/AlgH family protein [Verrucomicrobiae bacterium]|nr:YqgE/AlgH family protein [Verrucomicrobiae bacterium]